VSDVSVALFPFAEYWWFYVAFTGFVLFMLALDLGVFHRNAHEVKFKEATIWCVIWIGLALAFNYFLYRYSLYSFSNNPRLAGLEGFDSGGMAKQTALEFLTGFIVEKSLAIDNIFVFVLIFAYFGIPLKYQHRVLFYGIIGALIFRAIFIALGSVLMQYHTIVMLFGVFLIITGIKLMFSPEKKIEPEKNPLIRLLKRFLPVTSSIEGQSLFVRKAGVIHGTPLLVALVVVEVSDIIFAVDSVPAIFAITKEPLIVFTSNMFAILGLRAMFFMLAAIVEKFYLLKYGLAIILVFVGLKMVWLNELWGGKFPISYSLGIISAVLSLSVLCSFLFPRAASAVENTRAAA